MIWTKYLPYGAILAAGAGASLALTHNTAANVGQTVRMVGFAVVSVSSSSPSPTVDLTLNYQVSGNNAGTVTNELTHDVTVGRQTLQRAGIAAADLSIPSGFYLNYVNSIATQKCQMIEKIKHLKQLNGCPPNVGFQVSESLQAVIPVSQLTKVFDQVHLQSLVGSPTVNVNSAEPSSAAVPSTQAMSIAYREALNQAKANASLLAQEEGKTLGEVVKISEGMPENTFVQGNGGGPSVAGEPQVGPGQELVGVTITYQLR